MSGTHQGLSVHGDVASLRRAAEEPSGAARHFGKQTFPLTSTHIPGSIVSDFKDLHLQLFPANNEHLTICSRWETSTDPFETEAAKAE